MAEIVILLAIKKIGIALTKGAADQASVQFAKHGRQLLELQGNMGRVAREFHVMHDVLCQMDIRTRNNQVYEGWLAEVRKVAHVMEDMVDEYLYLVGREHDMGFWFYLKKGFRKPRSLLSLNQIAFKVKQIEKDLAHLLEIKNRWVTMINNGDPSNSNYIVSRSQDQANVAHSLDDEDLVGVDENREKLGQWLASHDLGHYVIALIGMGGLGKTALAANVYKKERKKFECHAWVSISQTYSREVVLRNIIKELSRDKVSVLPDTSAMHIRHLEETLMSFLQQRKYLIILDDVWTPKAFEDLSTVFVHNNKGSRLIITTRECNVAALASPGHILTLEALQENMAWDLFCKKAFPSSGGLGNGARGGLDRQLMDKRVLGFTGLRFLTQILHKYSFGYLGWLSDASLLAPTLGMPLFPSDTCHDCPAELKLLSKEIANKCKGLPLVIVCVGSFLRLREKTVEEWRNINDQLGWELINNSRLDHIRNVLHLSFIYLPTHLKSCFLYCSLFPEGYIFKRKELVRLWTAEGFVKERGGSTLEVVAEGYLKELIDRNILQLVERNTFGRMKKVTMHDILRELAVDLCKKNCFGVAYEDRCGGSLEMDGRRLVLHKLRNDDHKTIPGIHQLRTFITLDSSMPLSTITLLCKESRYMTVLELSGLPIEKIPDAIGDLFNLRHLGLRDSKVQVLPKSVEKLSNLLTLDICGCDIHEFRGIVKLKKLRHLFAEKIIDQSWRDFHCRRGIRITRGLGNLRNLHTLQALEAHDESLRHLGELRQLRSLRLWNVKEIYCADINESIVQMQYLSNLSVNASDENEVLMLNVLVPSLQRLNLRGRLTKGALEECPLFQATEEHKLCYLVLFWSQLEQDPLSSLSRLSHLTYLEFTRAYNGEQLEFCTGWFPKLKILLLVDLPNLSRLEVQERAMVCLEKLFFTNLNSMTEVPSSIEFLMSLKYLGFYQISSDFLTLLHQSSAIKGTQWSHTLRP